MNQLGKSNACRVCDINFVDLLNRTDSIAARERLWRQIFAGICDGCQIKRQNAAVEYIAAADEVRTLLMLGAGYVRRGTPTQALGAAMRRVNAADKRCTDLKMWASGPREETT